MTTWQLECARQVRMLIAGDHGRDHLKKFCCAGLARRPQLHLAIFLEPYLTFILDGKKTVESRFSCVRCAPYAKVQANDLILLKRAVGPVVGICRVDAAWFYRIDRHTLKDIRKRFADKICPAESGFWSDRTAFSFATLISLADVTPLPEFRINKRDRRGWVTISTLF